MPAILGSMLIGSTRSQDAALEERPAEDP